MKIQQLHPDLFYVDYLAKSMGLNFEARSILIRHQGKLSVISPGPLSPELQTEVERLGEVAQLIAPNGFHHLYYAQWQEAYPKAESWGPTILTKKRKDLNLTHVLKPPKEGEEPPNPLPEALQVYPLGGIPGIQEWLFYHEASQTLIVTDLIFNLKGAIGALSKFNFWMMGIYKKTATSRLFKTFTKDKAALKESLLPLLELPLKGVLVNHGGLIQEQPSETLQEALQWVLKT